MRIAIIGGGAAGFFSAITAKENYPDARITIFEKSLSILSKVKISGGGRCNVTNACTDISELSRAYPRGSRFLKKAFYTFSTQDTMQWFESRGVPLVTQDDNCVFPASQNSQSIFDVFIKETSRLGIIIKLGFGIKNLKTINDSIEIHFSSEEKIPEIFDKVIVATGGSPKRKGLEWLKVLGHKIENPVPSLFTFNMPTANITKLMGVVVENTIVKIQGTKLENKGALLITHWGMSGPAILKLSAYGARILSEKDYNFNVQINWINEKNNELVLSELLRFAKNHISNMISNKRPYQLPKRLWLYLLEQVNLSEDKRWSEIGKKTMNKLVNLLTNDSYSVQGKTTFKEEFVTCGGVSLSNIDVKTMQSKVVKNLYFAGEVLDIDGITGGYNFQAAWTTGFIAGKLK